jgi:succinyl-diaminopimelate desuccinylase
MYEDIFSKIKREDVIETIQKLVRIPTEHDDLDWNKFDYMPMVKCLIGEFKKLGMETNIVGKPHFPNAIGRLKGTEGKPSLIISGHYNTVPIGDRSLWTHDPFGAEIEGDRIHGRGSSDMLGGITSAIVAIKALVESGVKLKGDLVTFFWAGEGASEHSVNWVFENHPELVKTDWGFKCEGALTSLRGGLLWLELMTKGKNVHAPGVMQMAEVRKGKREKIQNALTYMRMLLDAMENIEGWMTWKPEPDMPGAKTVCSPTVIDAGVKVNIIPDVCRAQVDFRTMPSQNKETILKELSALIEKLKVKNPGFNAEITKVIYYLPSTHVPKDHYIMRTVLDVTEEVLGFRPDIKPGMTIPTMEFIPTVSVGSIARKGYGAHTVNEWVSIDSCVNQTKLFAALYQKVLG